MFFFGDFNVVLGANEKRGGNLPLAASSEEFQAWSDSCKLIHIETTGVFYTWSNGRGFSNHTELRLDRSVCSDEWLNFWEKLSCCTLTKSHSDHYLVLLTMSRGEVTYPPSFKFFKMWIDHPDYRRLIAYVWKDKFVGNPRSVLSSKLIHLKRTLRKSNKEVFGGYSCAS